MSFLVFLSFFLASKWLLCESLFNNLALTPPMGWSTWGRFRCNVDCKKYPKECISEMLVREMVDKIVDDGYLSAGYDYVLIDDCWLAKTRDESGRLQPDYERFPSGIKNLSSYVHARGLKFGIYEDYGVKTCEGYPGIVPKTMQIDAETFASWDIDFIKIDGCYSEPADMVEGFEKLGKFFLYTGRPMVYSCSWPTYLQQSGISINYTAAAVMCNLWRNYKDIQDSWVSVRSIVNYFGDHQEEFAPYAGPGHWNDPDLLIIGNFGLSFEQAKMQMALWAILAAPLIMSNDLRTMHPEFRQILQNPRLIQINQDVLGIQGKRIFIDRNNKYEVWVRPVLPMSSTMTSWAIAIVSFDDEGLPKPIAFSMKYTKLWGKLHHYTFVDLFNSDCAIEFTSREELLTRVPPLGALPCFRAKVSNHIMTSSGVLLTVFQEWKNFTKRHEGVKFYKAILKNQKENTKNKTSTLEIIFVKGAI